MRVLVLGGYGLIGLAVSRCLLRDGHEVTGLARSARRGRSLLPDADWIKADLSGLTEPARWQVHLRNVDAVVNASGILQDAWGEDVIRVQRDAIVALIAACQEANITKFIQISAPGVSETSDTAFFRSKAAADAALRDSRLNWTIFRPGLVLSPQAWGGTGLLRMLAAFPVVQPLVLAEARIQTVCVDDVAQAVSSAVSGRFAGGDFDLVEAHPHTLETLVLRMRQWLGFGRPLAVVRLPPLTGRIVSRAADMAGLLGWRSALRTTSLRVLADNISGNGHDWMEASGRPLSSLDETLGRLPSTAQERIYARAQLVFPVALLVLAGFWLVSGILGLVQAEAATRILADRLPGGGAEMAVLGGSLADIALGAAMLVRPLVRAACLASIVVSIGYLTGSAVLTPELWTDPLGPMVKVFPVMALAIAVAALAERR